MEAFVQVTPVEASLKFTSKEAFVEAKLSWKLSWELTSMEASMEAFVEVTSM